MAASMEVSVNIRVGKLRLFRNYPWRSKSVFPGESRIAHFASFPSVWGVADAPLSIVK